MSEVRPVVLTKKRKWGTACAYKGCGYKFYSDSESQRRRFFRFPRDKALSEIWIKNCGRLDLMGKDPKQLYLNFRLCAIHFEDEMFYTKERTRLLPHGEPRIFQNSILIKMEMTPEPESVPSTSIELEEGCIKTEPVLSTSTKPEDGCIKMEMTTIEPDPLTSIKLEEGCIKTEITTTEPVLCTSTKLEEGCIKTEMTTELVLCTNTKLEEGCIKTEITTAEPVLSPSIKLEEGCNEENSLCQEPPTTC